VSELFSNQSELLLTQVDQNLEMNFDLGNFDQEAFNTFPITSLLTPSQRSFARNPRWRHSTTNTLDPMFQICWVTGLWIYLLTLTENSKVKMYSRNNINQLLNNSIGSQTAIYN